MRFVRLWRLASKAFAMSLVLLSSHASANSITEEETNRLVSPTGALTLEIFTLADLVNKATDDKEKICAMNYLSDIRDMTATFQVLVTLFRLDATMKTPADEALIVEQIKNVAVNVDSQVRNFQFTFQMNTTMCKPGGYFTTPEAKKDFEKAQAAAKTITDMLSAKFK